MGVELEDSRTAYHVPEPTQWDHILGEEKEDPNADIPLCRACAKIHHENWDDMWNTYYSGLL